MARILLIRFSALGDVAMTVPVIYSLATQYPQHQFTMLSRSAFEPLFRNMPANVDFVSFYATDRHKGLLGLHKLYSELAAMHFDYVADLHDVLRTKLLRLRFALSGIPTAHIDKGRSGKKALVRKDNKCFQPQKSSFHRYADVMGQLGFPLNIQFTSIYPEGEADASLIAPIVGSKAAGTKWIGIAPFAKHDGKIYPIELQEQVVAHFAGRNDVRVFLFGGGAKEKAVFDGWIAKYPTVVSLIGKLNMELELNLISHLDVMLSMDSANMHLASLVNTPVVSVWGATHPHAGFMGWNQQTSNAVQLDLPCRPCSVFGQKPCYRDNYECLRQITPSQLIDKLETILTK